jgi:hypothetical protein
MSPAPGAKPWQTFSGDTLPDAYIFLLPGCPFANSEPNAAISRLCGMFTMGVFIGGKMRKFSVLAALMFVALPLQAKDKPAYEKGVLLQMESSSCGFAEKDGKTVAGEIFGTDGQHKNTKQVLCQEYTLQTDRVTYRIRPKDDKHPALLPIGETAAFRIHKDKLLLRVIETEDKEREYIVVSMTPRTDVEQSQSASAHAVR